VAQLALNDNERHAFASHLDSVGVPELVRGEATPHTGSGGRPTQLGTRRGIGPVAAARWSVDDAEQRSDWELEPCLKPWRQLLPAPGVHSDLATAPALAVTHEQRSASRI